MQEEMFKLDQKAKNTYRDVDGRLSNEILVSFRCLNFPSGM